MKELHRVTDDRGAKALADRLNGNDRTRSIVVITIPAGLRTPYIDAEKVLDQVGDLADVYVIATGPHTWTFSGKMPERTQVYGGAGRVYPLGHEWVSRPQVSPLRFAYNEEEGQRATRSLISDALNLAAAAGLVRTSAAKHRVRAEGEVIGFPVPERAMVKFDGRVAQIAQELTESTVPLEHVVTVGMRVSGWFDADTGRLDISENLLPAEVALQSYGTGDVVLAEVASVEADRAELRLHPKVRVSVNREDLTGNDLDDLRTLMTLGEVLPARVVATGPTWALTLIDVEDEESPLPAAALIPGGPPWIVPGLAGEVGPQWIEDDAAILAFASPAARSEAKAAAPELGTEVSDNALRPTPALFDKRRRSALVHHAPAPATESMTLTIDALRSEVASFKRRLEEVDDELRASIAERAALILLRQDQERQVARLEHDLQVQRAQLRKARRPTSTAPRANPEFADPEQAFRYAVLTAWASRIPVGEQPTVPLPEYDVGPNFLNSLNEVPGVAMDKVAGVAVEILTGRAPDVAGRELHQLRESLSGNAPYIRRPTDDATCWRAALQVNTSQARRIHYWVLPGGRVEFSRVVLHDDFRP
jgi:hypothetical protein